MFNHKKSHFTRKFLVIPFALICGIFLAITGHSSIDISSSIVLPKNTSEISHTDDSVFQVYTQRIEIIQKATQTLMGELLRLHEAKTGLQNSINLKKHLLTATVSKNTDEIETDSTTTIIKNLTQEISTLSKQLQDYEVKITDIYSKIGVYGQEMDDLSHLIN